MESSNTKYEDFLGYFIKFKNNLKQNYDIIL